MMRIKLICDKCEKEWEQTVEYMSQIEWVCPSCKSKEHTFSTEIEDDEKDNEPLVMGRGGCGKQKTW